MTTPTRFSAEVTAIIRHSSDVATYEFRCLGGRPRHKPGQFLHLALDPFDPAGYWPESRVFTIANGATTRNMVRLTIAAKGAFTQRIFRELQIGQQVSIKAPYGEFIVRTAPRTEAVLLAGGTGVTPFVAFLEDALVQGIEGEVRLHYAARRPELLVFRELADRCAVAFPRFQVRYYAEEDADGVVIPGRIDLEAVCRQLHNPTEATFYLCGPQEMVASLSLRLDREMGVAAERIRVDQWE